MSRLTARLLVPALAVIALGALAPTHAAALPKGPAILSAAERLEAAPGRLSQFWSLLSALWAENGSILDPDGGPKPSTTNSGDNGSGLDPNG